jgi:catechol 2,3-dioxygenase-like lactoylglutathione lyase family enzyme
MEPLDSLRHIALTVSDLERSVTWYREVLGMVEHFREDAPTRKAVVFRFAGGSPSVGLVEHVGSRALAFDPTVTGLDHFAFSVRSQDEMRQWVAHLDAHGVQHSGPIEIPPGEILNFKDPDGLALSLFWDKAW